MEPIGFEGSQVEPVQLSQALMEDQTQASQLERAEIAEDLHEQLTVHQRSSFDRMNVDVRVMSAPPAPRPR